jgi:hypothetical protein
MFARVARAVIYVCLTGLSSKSLQAIATVAVYKINTSAAIFARVARTFIYVDLTRISSKS